VQTKISQLYKDKTILITGGSGYIGSSLTNQLSEIDCNLKVLTRSSSWRPKAKNANLVLISGDVSDFSFWDTILDDVDYIFHLASVEEDINNYKREIEINAISILHLLNVCKNKDLSPKIIFASSANIFGNASSLPINEDFSDNPASLWSINKLLVEQYLKLYYYKFNINSVSLRLPNVYGVASNIETNNRTVINNVISSALNGKELLLYKNHNCIRDYISIDDVVSAFLFAGSMKKNILKGQFYVVGSEEGNLISDVWGLISKIVSKKIGKIVTIKNDASVQLEPMELRNFVADSSNFRNLTGWNSKVSLEKGIKITVDKIYDSPVTNI